MPLLDCKKYRYWLKRRNAGLWDLVVLFEQNGFGQKNPAPYKEVSDEQLKYFSEMLEVQPKDLLFIEE